MTGLDLIDKIKKYGIIDFFDSDKRLNDWIDTLSKKEIENLISLNIDKEDITFPIEILINNELLKTNDYNKKIEALSKIKNADDYYHLYSDFLTKNFLESKSFYSDIEMVSKVNNVKYCLSILGDSEFLKSSYHNEDLKLIIEASNSIEKDKQYVCESLVEIAKNKDSIESKYHREDMKLIANTEGSKLQKNNVNLKSSINFLATNKVSLNDDKHIENMNLLLNNKEIGEFLYLLMTDDKFLKSDNYSKVINEMITNKKDSLYVKMLSIYAVGAKKTNALLYDIYLTEEKGYKSKYTVKNKKRRK